MRSVAKRVTIIEAVGPGRNPAARKECVGDDLPF